MAVIVAYSVLPSGIDESGVTVIISVVDCPCASGTGVREVVVSPAGSTAVSTTSSDAFPTLVRVSVVGTGTPGVVATVAGLAVTVTALIAGTVNISLAVVVSVGLVVLVSVTSNGTLVPCAGIVPVGTMQIPTSPVSPAGIVSCATLVSAMKPSGTLVGSMVTV